jgi:hypothetical protein
MLACVCQKNPPHSTQHQAATKQANADPRIIIIILYTNGAIKREEAPKSLLGLLLLAGATAAVS